MEIIRNNDLVIAQKKSFSLQGEFEKAKAFDLSKARGNSVDELQIKSLKAKPLSLRGTPKATMEQIDKSAEEFEAVFLSQMLAPMFEGGEADEMFGGGKSEETYNDMLTNEYGKLIARVGGIGISDHVKREMISMQGDE